MLGHRAVEALHARWQRQAYRNEIPQHHHRDSPSSRIECAALVLSGQHGCGCGKFGTEGDETVDVAVKLGIIEFATGAIFDCSGGRMAKLSEEEKARRATNRRRHGAVLAEEEAARQTRKRQEWVANGTYLSRAELEARVPCHGCSQPIIDDLGQWPPLMKLDDEQKRDYEAADAAFKSRHPDCHSSRWSMAGSRTTHCSFCCPPPPLSERQIQKIKAILTPSRRPDPADLDTWTLTLTCDHVVEKRQHSSNRSWYRSVEDCQTCDRTRGVVTAERVPNGSVQQVAEHHQAQEELTHARQERDRLHGEAEAARRKVSRLERQFRAHSKFTADPGVS